MQFDLVVANYNNGMYLPALVESLRTQTHESWHLYIVDDCSTDDSAAFLNAFEGNPQITLIRLQVNAGATHAFKTGIEAGHHPLIGLIGADDTLPATALETMLTAYHQEPSAALHYSECMDCDSSMTPIQKREHAKPLNPSLPVFHQLHSIFNFLVFPREKYTASGGLNGKLRRAMDHDLILRLDEVGTMNFVPEVCYHYRNHSRGISQGGNGVLAAQYSRLAQIQAYQRRTEKPISPSEFRSLRGAYEFRSVELSQSCEGKSIFHHALQAGIMRPSVVFQRNYWKGLFRPILKPIKR